jgi:hypothetical protein
MKTEIHLTALSSRDLSFFRRESPTRIAYEVKVRMEDPSWREAFTTKSIHEIRQIVYDTRLKAAEKKGELRTVVR